MGAEEDFTIGAISGPEIVETITRRRRREAAPTADGRGWVLRYSRFSRRLYVAIAALFGFCLVASTISWVRIPTTAADLLFRLVVFGGFSILCAYAVLASRKQIRLDDRGVRSNPAFGSVKTLAWNEIERLRFSVTNKSLTLVGRDTSIKIYLYTMDGTPKVHEYLQRYLPDLLERSGLAGDERYLRLVT